MSGLTTNAPNAGPAPAHPERSRWAPSASSGQALDKLGLNGHEPNGQEPGPNAPALFAPSPRIAALRSTLLAERYSICLERPELLARFASSPEGRAARDEHPLVRRALALAYVLSHRKPRVYPDELVIGNLTSKRVAANYYPEGGSLNVLEDLFRLDKRAVPLSLTASEKLRLAGIALRTGLTSVGGRALLKPGRFSYFLDFFRARRYFVTEEAGIGHQVGDYGRVVREGLRPANEEAARRLIARTFEDGRPVDPDQEAFFRSVRIAIGGIRAMAENLAGEARRQAEAPGLPPERRDELLAASAACRRVPYEPARTFIEGLNACWLVHVALNLEDFEQGLSFGRLDQILLPLYRADLERGALTRAQATEAAASFCLKTCEAIPLYSERVDRFFSGNAVAEGITLGGTDADGADATNELSLLFLDAYAQVRTREPALHARVHAKTPRWFLDRCVEVLQLGFGKPSFFGDEAVVRALETAGMSRAHARDYAVIGCVEMASQGRTYNSSDAALFNLPLCLELALNGGRPFGERRRVGAATAPAAALRSFDEVVAAFRAQVDDAVADLVRLIGWLEEVYRVHRPTPVNSLLTDGCLSRGRDVTWGGASYDFTSIQCVGLADAGDSLYALARLVFEEKRLTLEQLVRILEADFAGHDALRAELQHRFARYGNGDSRADAMTQLAADAFTGAVTANRNGRGGRYLAGFYSMTCNHGFGLKTGALPNGRRAGTRLSNGLAPADGVERQGPSAVLRSAASLDSSRFGNCAALNLKFEKSTVQGRTGRAALVSLFRNYFDHGGMQVQVNVLDADELRAAKKDPAAHPGIVVRVAGYCAYFTDLQPSVQDEIIERTAHGLG